MMHGNNFTMMLYKLSKQNKKMIKIRLIKIHGYPKAMQVSQKSLSSISSFTFLLILLLIPISQLEYSSSSSAASAHPIVFCHAATQLVFMTVVCWDSMAFGSFSFL
ncbi:hypothetical protein CUMW_285780 [Citrus unshiu]|uniref:Uncharacterized protein n=1 Tax=Citrus unshiu TaxID=55188 RepID=A0A2H5N157_CITUN|nr:hypothetical protein CUMW_285780 [Citrus unshiu]